MLAQADIGASCTDIAPGTHVSTAELTTATITPAAASFAAQTRMLSIVNDPTYRCQFDDGRGVHRDWGRT